MCIIFVLQFQVVCYVYATRFDYNVLVYNATTVYYCCMEYKCMSICSSYGFHCFGKSLVIIRSVVMTTGVVYQAIKLMHSTMCASEACFSLKIPSNYRFNRKIVPPRSSSSLVSHKYSPTQYCHYVVVALGMDTETHVHADVDIPSFEDMSDTNPLKTMMDTMGKHGANVELKRRMPDGTYQTASEGTMRSLGAQARMSSTAQVLNSMTKEERDLWSIEMRKMANELYRDHRYDEALGRYMEALTASDLGTAADSQCNIDSVIVPLLCNMSACCVQLKVCHCCWLFTSLAPLF